MKPAAAALAAAWAKDRVSSWENEGGSLAAPQRPVEHNPIEHNDGPSWLPSSVIDPPAAEKRGADRGVSDTHTLSILRVSLLLLVPVLGALAVFWASIATRAP